jgi:hypothetical protein
VEIIGEVIGLIILTPVIFLVATPFILIYVAFRRLQFETYAMAVGRAYRTLWERWLEAVFV